MTAIVSLPGMELAEMIFIRDYLQLGFDGPRISVLTNPSIKAAGRVVRFPDPGSRDALCGLIGAKVVEVQSSPEVLVLNFGSGRFLSIPLDEAGRRAPEAVLFDGFGGAIESW